MLSVVGLVLLVVLAGGVPQAHPGLLGRRGRHEDGGAVLEGRRHPGHASVVGQACVAVARWERGVQEGLVLGLLVLALLLGLTLPAPLGSLLLLGGPGTRQAGGGGRGRGVGAAEFGGFALR